MKDAYELVKQDFVQKLNCTIFPVLAPMAASSARRHFGLAPCPRLRSTDTGTAQALTVELSPCIGQNTVI
ncbi:hypothetical protein ACOMHN_067555 [Nucella lapillus]